MEDSLTHNLVLVERPRVNRKALADLRERAIRAAQKALPWPEKQDLFSYEDEQTNVAVLVFPSMPQWASQEEHNDSKTWVVKAQSRKHFIFRCKICKALDHIGICSVCYCNDTEVFVRADE